MASSSHPLRVLILGGTTEALALGRALENTFDLHGIFSLAGITPSPHLPHIETRQGGFGGIEGLATYLHAQGIGAVIDATHPFAAQMSRNAVAACAQTGTPLLRLQRPGWQASPDDNWIIVPDIDAATAALGATPRRVFLTTGRKDLAPFRAAPQHHYLIRSIVAPDPASLPPDHTILLQRPPFTRESETRLMREHRVDILVTKDAGSDATSPKLAAARDLGLPVVMIARPTLPPARTVATVHEAIDWLHGLAHAGTRRDV
ncbi:precorrin 6x reductase [Acetobacter estunensis NRIC 0472]|uniref:Cobalt-precorrin-6A reductase n=1 Tax=Acetobacter estunensis TaxID=104097 RepID=A0A967EHM1_9PROT|nr:cobalt-precorrin-6A reductase [Acetobacter estunensis]NHO53782.1 cobalt-precorrin-6A reductase [Acetobacter estunensis]GBQ20064.1 precorrin 6x reductase [Acetobacter estunensis NRIC 0472]